jgi:putative ABC transport system permease protein
MLQVAALVMPLEYRPFGPPELTWRVTLFAGLAGMSITAVSAGIGVYGGRPPRLARRGLLVVQGAMAMVLLTGAALLVGSYSSLLVQDPVLADNVTVASVRPLPGRSTRLQALEQNQRVADRLRRLPGVTGVAIGIGSLVDRITATATVDIAGDNQSVSVKFISSSYLSTLGIPLLAGRDFASGDAERVIVSESLASDLWPIGPAVGQSFATTGRGGFSAEVIGVARDVMDYALDVKPRRTVYRAMEAEDVMFASPFHFVLRVSDGQAVPEGVIGREIDRGIPGAVVSDVSLVGERLQESIADRTFVMFVGVVFASVAVVVCLLGVAAVVAFAVAHRAREIAIRLALGATMAQCGRLVAGEAVGLTLAGAMAGLVCGSWMSRSLESFLYGVQPTDPLILAPTALGMGLLALVVARWSLNGLALVQPARLLADAFKGPGRW